MNLKQFAQSACLCLAIVGAAEGQGLSPEILKQYRKGPQFWPTMVLDEGVKAKELAPLPKVNKPSWQTKEIEQLGKQMFFDPRLSSSGQIACVSCHEPQLGWADGRRAAFGHNRLHGSRNTMSILNTAFFSEFFWDGRSSSLEDQALKPIENPIEMNDSIESVLKRLNSIPAYKERFQKQFKIDQVDAASLAKALAAFERTVVSRTSRFDHFAKGRRNMMSDEQIHGLHLFRTKARCINCHNGALFSDGKFHNIGLSYYGRRFEDLGLYDHSGKEADKGKFRTPSLRDVIYTAPWMHNGLFVNLKGTLNLYNAGITINKKLKPGEPTISPHIKPLKLNRQELKALESFLHAISQRPGFVEPPKLPGLHEQVAQQ